MVKDKIRSMWEAVRKAFAPANPSRQSTVALETKQIEALVELYANLARRRGDLETQLSDLAGPITRLLRSGTEWQWFPDWDLTSNQERLQEWIRADCIRHSENYEIVSAESDLTLEQAGIQLLSPGIRHVKNKKALYRAKITLYRSTRPEDTSRLLDRLSQL